MRPRRTVGPAGGSASPIRGAAEWLYAGLLASGVYLWGGTQPTTAYPWIGAIVLAALWKPVRWRTFLPVVVVGTAAVPLPASWLRVLSAVAHDITIVRPSRLLGEPLPWHPLSLDPAATLRWTLYVLGMCAAFGLAAALGRHRTERRRFVARLTLLLLAAPIAAMATQADAIGAPRVAMQPDRWYPFPNANHTGLLCTVLAVLAQGLARSASMGRSRVLWLAVAATASVTTALTGSRGAAWLLAAMSLVLWWDRVRPLARQAMALLLTIAATLTTVVALSPSVATALHVGGLHEHARLHIWGDTLRMVADFPWFGIGAGSFAAVYPLYRTYHPPFPAAVLAPESEWLRLVVEMGIPVALMAVVAVAWLLWRTVPTGKADTSGTLRGVRLAFVSELVAACYDIQWMTPGHPILTAVLAGILYGARVAPAAVPPQPPQQRLQEEGTDAVV